MRGIVAGVVVALALLSPASAQETSRARLLTVPDAQALSDHFPPVALARGVSGRVVLSCEVAVDGSSACRAAEETPTAMGFGAAAEALAADWRFEPRRENGAAVASTSRVTIAFQNANAEPLVIERSVYVVPASPAPPSNEPELAGDAIVVTATTCANRRDCRTLSVRSGTPVQTQGFPSQAETSRTVGHALVACAIRSNRAADCALEAETPTGASFGAAAVSTVSRIMSNDARFAPGTAYRVPVHFVFRDAEGQVEEIGLLHLAERPSPRRAYSSRALDAGRDGDVVLACRILANRSLDCSVYSETPPNFGFGDRSLRMLDGAQLNEEAVGLPGFTEGERFLVPFIYRFSEAD